MLLKKMLRDISRNKMQFISIFLMSFLGMFVFSGIGGEWVGLQNTANQFYSETNLANAWLYGDHFTENDVESALNVTGVTGAERRLTVVTTGKYDAHPVVTLHLTDANTISGFHLTEGEPFTASADKIWLDDRFAKATGLHVGDPFRFTFQGMKLDKEIAGLVYGGEYVYSAGDGERAPDFSKTGYAYASAELFPLPGEVPCNELMLTTTRTDWAALEDDLANAMASGFTVFLPRENQTSVQMFQAEVEQHRAMGSIFPFAFFAIALLIILTTMTRMVNAQRIQIGTLKALGFKKHRILWHYMSYSFFLSLTGAALGVVIGPLTLPYLFYPSLSSFFTLPSWAPAYSPSFYVAAALFVAVCTGASWFACRKLLQNTPAETLRPDKPKLVKRGWLEKTRIWQKLRFGTQWNLRDITRNKVRSLMAVVGVLACTALLVCAFGMYHSFQDMKQWQYEEISRFSHQIAIADNATDIQVDAMREQVNGELLMQTPIELRAGGEKKTATATVTDNVTLLKTTDTNRNLIEIPEDGLAVSRQVAESLGVEENDTVAFHLYGDENWVEKKVTLIYRAPATQGITLSRQAFEALGLTFTPTTILTETAVILSELDGASGVWSKPDLMQSWDDLTESMMLMVVVLIVAAAVLAVVVLYNLGLLSFTERHRELATLRVIGFKNQQIKNLLQSQNFLLSVVGILIGIPCGKWLLDVMVATVGDGFDMMTFLSATTILLSTAITLLLSIGVTWLFSGKIRRINMAESLKAVE